MQTKHSRCYSWQGKEIFIFHKAPKPAVVPNQPPDNLLEIFPDIVHTILIYLGNVQKAEVVNICRLATPHAILRQSARGLDCGLYGDDLDMRSITP
jgi:hypothetical protein